MAEKLEYIAITTTRRIMQIMIEVVAKVFVLSIRLSPPYFYFQFYSSVVQV